MVPVVSQILSNVKVIIINAPARCKSAKWDERLGLWDEARPERDTSGAMTMKTRFNDILRRIRLNLAPNPYAAQSNG